MIFLRRYRIDIAIFALALAARLALFAVDLEASGSLIPAIRGDDGYFELSQGLVMGHGFSWDAAPPYRPNPLRTPLYPGFIALILELSGSYAAVIAIQIVLGALIPVFGRRIVLRLFGSERTALAVGIVLALEPYFALFSSIFYTETLFIFCFLVFVLIFLRYLDDERSRTLALAAAVLGIATLVKPTVQYLPVLIVPFLVFRFRAALPSAALFGRAALFAGVFLAVLSPWLVRNYQAFGRLGMTAQPAFNLHVYLIPSVLSVERGTSFMDEVHRRVTDEEAAGTVITLENSARYQRESFAVLREHKAALAQVVAGSFITFFTHDGMVTVLEHAGIHPDASLGAPALSLLVSAPLRLFTSALHFLGTPFVLVIVLRIFWIFVTGAFVAGSIMVLRGRPLSGKAVFALILIAYFALTTPLNGLGVNARFRMPVAPLILAFAAYPFFNRNEKVIDRHTVFQ